MVVHRVAKGTAPRLLRPLAGLLLVALAACPAAHAVTYVTVGDHPAPVTLVAGETVTIRFDVAKAGGTAQYRLARDITRSARYEPLAPVATSNPLTDGAGSDVDPAPGKIAWRFPVTPNRQSPAVRWEGESSASHQPANITGGKR